MHHISSTKQQQANQAEATTVYAMVIQNFPIETPLNITYVLPSQVKDLIHLLL